MLMAAFALSTTALMGCGGQPSQQSAATDDSQTEAAASTESVEAALGNGGVATGDVPSLTNADVAGYYLQDGATDLAFCVYQLDGNGTITFSVVAGDESMERKGTYEIHDGKIYMNIPEGETFELQGTTYKANAIKDGEITFENGVLTTKDASSGATRTYKKISDSEYQQRIKTATEKSPKKIAVGEQVTGDGYSFTVDSFEFQDEVYPSDTSGYYTYWEHEDDHDYLVADVTYTNEGTEYQVPGGATAALLTIGDNKYNATIETDGGPRTSSSYSLDPKETGRIIVLASIPDAAREEDAEIKLTWAFPRDGSLLQYSFSNDEDNVFYILTK